MTHNPVLLQSGKLPFLFSFSVGSELLTGKLQEEVLVRLETLECVLVLLDVALDLRNFLVQLLDLLLFARLLVL